MRFYRMALVPLISGAYLASRGVVALVASACAIPPAAASSAPPDEPRAALQKSADAILRRNPFDSARVRLDEPVEPGHVQTTRCDDVELHVLIAADPEWSFASLAVRGERPVMRRAGSVIGARRLAFVGIDHVLLEQGGVLCRANLFRDGARISSPTIGERTPGIERLSDNEFRIDRGARDRILEGQAELLGTAQIVADKVDGKVAGMKILRLKPDSPLARIGLRANDRLVSINGFDLSTPESGLMAYARLRDAPDLALAIVRDGLGQEIRYEVR